MTTSGLLKCGNLVRCWKQERGDPWVDNLVIDDDADSDTAAESNLSVRSRSLLNRVKMIRDMGNVELFELCETIPKVQCSECLLFWNQGIVYCTCGHLLKESEASQHFHQWRLDAFSIENYVIKKGRPRGARQN